MNRINFNVQCRKFSLLLIASVFGVISGFSQTISSVDPDSAWQGQTLQVNISGSALDFAQGTSVTVWIKQGNDSIIGDSYGQSATNIFSWFTIPSSSPTGLYDLFIGEGFTPSAQVPNGFEILPELPVIQAPTLISPANWTTITSNPVTFQWSSVSGASEYEYEMSYDPLFQYIEQSGLTQNSSISFPLNTGQVHWRVRSLNAADIPGQWSAVFNFTMSPPAHLVSMDPDQGYAGQPQFNVDISGVNLPFAPSTSATQYLSLEQGSTQINASDVEMLWSFGGQADLQIPLSSPVGYYDLNYEYPPYSPYSLLNAFYITDGNQFEGQVYIDLNGNQVFDGADVPYPFATINAGSSATSITQADGYYTGHLPSGSFDVSLSPLSSFTISPNSHTVNFSGSGEIIGGNDFALTAIPGVHDLILNIEVDRPPRPDWDMKVRLTFQNMGPSTEFGQVSFELPPGMTVTWSNDPSYTVTGNTVTWNYVDLLPFESRFIQVNTYTPLSYQIGEMVTVSGQIVGLGVDQTPLDNQVTLLTEVVDSYDPNIKEVNPSGALTPEILSGQAYMNYTVHFQNTGTAEAINIYIHDTISQLLDLSTFQFIGSSHDAEVHILDNRLVEFRFTNINLPDSTTNELESHGSVSYRIKPHAMLGGMDLIQNTAYIYFDLNVPVVTNTTENWILTGIEDPQTQTAELKVWPNPTAGALNVLVSSPSTVSVFDINGKMLQSTRANGLLRMDLQGLKPGMYLIQSINEEGSRFARVILD